MTFKQWLETLQSTTSSSQNLEAKQFDNIGEMVGQLLLQCPLFFSTTGNKNCSTIMNYCSSLLAGTNVLYCPIGSLDQTFLKLLHFSANKFYL
jgi:hypothetical protein